MNRGKRGKFMTISPLIKKNFSMSVLSKIFFVFVDKLGNIVKIFNIVSSIPFQAIAGPVDEVLNCMAFTFFDNSLVK